MIWKAAKTSALLSGLFLAIYGGCNRFTAMRHGVGSFYFGWERHIPFVPLMIVPYMSIDLFFVCAPFLCTDDRERRTLARRITLAICVAGMCFLLFPLKFAFDRPHVSGWLGVIFNNFRLLDQPYNQLPSLHMALRTILAVTYVRHTRGFLRWSVRGWFSLIGFSTVLTYQHHIVDVIGGLILAAACIYLFQDELLSKPVMPNRRVGGYYGALALLLTGAAWLMRPWGYWLLWPAASTTLMTAGYFRLGPGIFRKREGKISFVANLFLWPILLGQRISLAHYARQCRPWDRLTDHVWIGRKLNSDEAKEAIRQGLTAVLDLTGEFSESSPFLKIPYLNIQVLDLTAPTPPQLQEAIAFVREHAAVGIVYIHCKAGYSRTAVVAAAYLLAIGQVSTPQQTIQTLRSVRPSIVIRPEAAAAIERIA